MNRISSLPREVNRALLALVALAGAVMHLQWFLTLPSPVPASNGEYTPLIYLFVRMTTLPLLPRTAGMLIYAVIALTGLLASLLALVLVYKSDDLPNARQLSTALALGSLSAAILIISTCLLPYREWVLATNAWQRFLLDGSAYTMGLAGMLALLRFFLAYPRRITPEDYVRLRWARLAARTERARSGWRRHFYTMKWLQPVNVDDEKQQRAQHIEVRFMTAMSEGHLWRFPMMLGFACAAVDAGGRFGAQAGDASGFVGQLVLSFAGVLMIWVSILGPLALLFPSWVLVAMHRREGTPDDRRRIDWIYATLFVTGIVAFVLPGIGQILFFGILAWASDVSEVFPLSLLFPYPNALAVACLFLGFVVALALSIFYRGTIDPRLAARRITVWSVITMIVTLLFLIAERFIALRFVTGIGLPLEVGVLVSGAMVVATMAPLRSTLSRVIGDLVARILPLDQLIEGPRRTVAVVFSDLSGYTRLCADDERQGLLAGALLQRQADRIARAHGGRLVRAIGDAVMIEFTQAADAAAAMLELHQAFPQAARQLGIEPLPVHSGAHVGEVVAPVDNDLFGTAVNLTARLQGAAEPGKIVVSDAFRAAAALGDQALRALGQLQFKNIPTPVECFELVTRAAPA